MENGIKEAETLTVEYQKHLKLTCVESVDGFTETQLRLTISGKRVTVIGNGLKISSFNKATGAFSADGVITQIRYDGAKNAVLKKFFK